MNRTIGHVHCSILKVGVYKEDSNKNSGVHVELKHFIQ